MTLFKSLLTGTTLLCWIVCLLWFLLVHKFKGSPLTPYPEEVGKSVAHSLFISGKPVYKSQYAIWTKKDELLLAIPITMAVVTVFVYVMPWTVNYLATIF